MYPQGTTKNTGSVGQLPVTTPPNRFLIMQLHSAAGQSSKPNAFEKEAMNPTVISRQEWGAAAPKKKQSLNGSAKRVVIHHTALPSCTGLEACKSRVASIQRGHMTEKGFDDIGYNFLVGNDGTVYEGRGWGLVGAHAKGNNHDSLGIAFMGNFNSDTPSTAAIASVKQLLKSGVSKGFLQSGFVLLGHRDLGQTECPGNNLYAALTQLGS